MAKGDPASEEDPVWAHLNNLARRMEHERTYLELEDSSGRVVRAYGRFRRGRGGLVIETDQESEYSLSQGYAIRDFL